MELMDIISTINELVLPPESLKSSFDFAQVSKHLEQRLRSLPQLFVPHGRLSHLSQENAIIKTAELYRLASLIYFQRAVRRISQDSSEVRALLQNALIILEDLEVCSAPWPMFIIACEVRESFERTSILKVLESSEKFRKAGNLVWLRNMILAMWKQDDLETYSSVLGKPAEPFLRYGAALSACPELPTFV